MGDEKRTTKTSILAALLTKGLPAVATIGLTAVVAFFGLGLVRAQTEREIYRDKVRELATTYESLRDQYNDAVRRTSVTELVVEEGELSVSVRGAGGEVRRVETPYNPEREIYVDYALLDGRVWIRRIFDSATPPDEAVVIDPGLSEIDWDARVGDGRIGKAVYRSLSEGRWVIDVTGSGALGIRKLRDGESVELAGPPVIASYSEIQEEASAAADKISWGDVINRLFGW